MIKNIIFDFGDIFINLDKLGPAKALQSYGYTEPTSKITALSNAYEKGEISSAYFTDLVGKELKNASSETLKKAWNSMILDFPEYRLKFIKDLAKQKKYRLFLLSNTNELHIEQVQLNMELSRYQDFRACFEHFYLSHEIHMRKPDLEIYKFVIEQHSLLPHQTLFIDDTKENTDAAERIGIATWNLKVGVEDIIELKSHL